MREGKIMPTARAENLYFYKTEPFIEPGGARSWYGRSQNVLVVYSRVEPGQYLEATSENEYFVVVIEGSVMVSCDDESANATGRAQVIVPPGDSRVEATTAGVLVRVFAPPPADLVARAVNNASYDAPHPNVADHELWPMPRDGYKLRVYEYDKMPDDARKVFRSRNIMVNWGGIYAGPRDLTKLSPHKHDDFEQVSMCISGHYTHHIRYPWESDSTTWMDDDHIDIETPSITIMPPPALHTSVGMGERNSLVDIFGPPRVDFSVGGMVNAENAAAYPMPDIGGRDRMRSGENCQIEGLWRAQCADGREVTVLKGDLFPSCPEHGVVEYVLAGSGVAIGH
jgi:hypothetical protein